MDFSAIVPALPGLWNGMLMTLQLMVLGVLGGVVLGTLLAIARLSHNRLLANAAATAAMAGAALTTRQRNSSASSTQAAAQ